MTIKSEVNRKRIIEENKAILEKRGFIFVEPWLPRWDKYRPLVNEAHRNFYVWDPAIHDSEEEMEDKRMEAARKGIIKNFEWEDHLRMLKHILKVEP